MLFAIKYVETPQLLVHKFTNLIFNKMETKLIVMEASILDDEMMKKIIGGDGDDPPPPITEPPKGGQG